MVVHEQTRSKSFLVKFRIWNDLKVVWVVNDCYRGWLLKNLHKLCSIMQKICKNWDFMIQSYFQLFVCSFHFFWNWLLFLHDKYNFQCPALYFQVPQIVPTNLLEWMLLFPLSRMRRQSRLEWVQTEQTSLTLQLLLSMLGKWDMHPCHMIWKIICLKSMYLE